VVTNHEMTWKRVDGSQFPVMINVRVDRHGLELRFEASWWTSPTGSTRTPPGFAAPQD
jgi:hypothetical protein